MKEFGLVNINTNETTTMYGYNATDVYRRAKLDASIWHIDYIEYID